MNLKKYIFSYAGPEISYPVKPFTLSTESQDDFWNRCLHLSLRASDQVNIDYII